MNSNAVAPMCLAGYTFCFTGVMTDLHRDDAVEMVKILGGRVTGNVSSKTDYLVAGEILEDGRPTDQGSKYKRAVTEPNVALVNGASQFYGLLQQYSDRAAVSAEGGAGCGASTATALQAPPAAAAAATSTNGLAQLKAPPVAAAPSVQAVNPYAKVANPYAKVNPYAKKPAANGNNTNAQKAAATGIADRKPAAKPATGSKNNNGSSSGGGGNQLLWVEKYKPVQSSEILGNQDAVRKLSVWLASWEERFLYAKGPKSFSSPNGPWKAALLSGPPGIGSTFWTNQSAYCHCRSSDDFIFERRFFTHGCCCSHSTSSPLYCRDNHCHIGRSRV